MVTPSQAPEGLAELLLSWGVLRRRASKEWCVSYVARHTRIPRSDIEHLRRVRDRCAHPEYGWPTQQEADRALDTARLARTLLDL